MKHLKFNNAHKSLAMARKHQPLEGFALVATLSALTIITTTTCISQLCQAAPSYQQQQQQQSQSHFAANDLYPPSVEFQPYKSLARASSSRQQNLINDKQQNQVFRSNGPQAVINGNHATYVEPPVDFKPIIYEPERQVYQPSGTQQAHVQQAAVAAAPQYGNKLRSPLEASANSESLVESQNQLVPSMSAPAINTQVQSPSSRQQQKRQTQAPAILTQEPSVPAGENQIVRARDNEAAAPAPAVPAEASSNAVPNEDEDEPNVLPMKPSIDRWSDWHDMSVDPDLASSDTQLSPASTLFYSKQQRQDKSAGPSLISSASSKSGQPPARRWQSDQVESSVKQRQLELGMQQPTQQQQQRNPLIEMFQANDQTSRFVPAPSAFDQKQRFSALPVQEGNLIRMQQNFEAAIQQQQQQLAAARGDVPSYQFHQAQWQAPGQAAVADHPFYYILQQQQQQPMAPPQGPQHQHYENARTRSSFFVGDSQQPAAQIMMPPPPPPPPPSPMLVREHHGKKMVNLFRASAANNNNQHRLMALGKGTTKRLGKSKPSLPPLPQQNAEVRVLRLGEQRLNSPLVQLNQQQQQQITSGTDMSSSQAHLGKRVSAANRVLTLPTDGAAQGQRGLVNKQAGNFSTSSQPRRVLRRRRIKTLVPVGLSSWFLGGIRDLDARHWKLPADVISKLAVNDVDLQHSEQPTPFVGAPASPDEMVNMSNQVQSGGSIEKADAPRPSTTRSPASPQQPMSPR